MSKLSNLDQRRRRLRLNLSAVERLESRNSTTDISSHVGPVESPAARADRIMEVHAVGEAGRHGQSRGARRAAALDRPAGTNAGRSGA